MRNNRHKIIALVLLSVLVCAVLVGAGKAFLKPVSPITPVAASPTVKTSMTFNKLGIKKKSVKKQEVKDNKEIKPDEKKQKPLIEKGIDREKLFDKSKERTITKKPFKKERYKSERSENCGEYNNHGGSCPQVESGENNG